MCWGGKVPGGGGRAFGGGRLKSGGGMDICGGGGIVSGTDITLVTEEMCCGLPTDKQYKSITRHTVLNILA
jgi:hypothetical protein